jgi:hypothetical protein
MGHKEAIPGAEKGFQGQKKRFLWLPMLFQPLKMVFSIRNCSF